MSSHKPLIDTFDRIHTNLRISVTDRCNIRCFYCMPETAQFLPKAELLTYEEIVRFVRIVAQMGVCKLRLTGGEPLVRTDLPRLIEMLTDVPGIRDIALTTNGVLLSEQARALKDAGLRRINISLDGLSEETFRKISRRQGLNRVLDGIFAAQRLGFEQIRLNAVAIRGITEVEVIPLGQFARQHSLEMRFIEFMPLDAEGNWRTEKVLSGENIRRILEAEFGSLVPIQRDDPSQTAVDYEFADGIGRIGFINPVTQPFCHNCNRLRITAEGKFRNCLFSTHEWDMRGLLRMGAPDDEIVEAVRASVLAKKRGHGIDSDEFIKPERAMYQIGG